MADGLDFREEAKACLHLAKAEKHPDVRTVLMGMVVGWLELADHVKSPAEPQDELADNA
jgi:hypothetical protein